MTEAITPGQFHEAAGIEDWRVLFYSACSHYRTKLFAQGVALVEAIGRLGDAENHASVDLRHNGVTVCLATHVFGGLSQRDVMLARRISEAASELGLHADPAAVQAVQVTIDALVIPDVRRSGVPSSDTRTRERKTCSIRAPGGRRSGSSVWTRPARSAIAATSTCRPRTIRPRLESRRPSPPADAW